MLGALLVVWSGALVVIGGGCVLCAVCDIECVARGEVGCAAKEYFGAPNWGAWEADRAPRMAFLVESVIVERGKVP